MIRHEPVMLKECIEGLNIRPDGTYVDATYGGGGHARAIQERLPEGSLIAFDRDKEAGTGLPDESRFLFINGNFRHLTNYMKYYGIKKIDGLIGDLGISSHQLDKPERGFSFRFDGKLDMRMNPDAETKAADVINEYPREKLVAVFREYGEVKNAGGLAEKITKAREQKRLLGINEFIGVIDPCVPRKNRNKYLARVFQALRIEVNDELAALRELLKQATGLLKEGGRMVMVTYHSLEDRLVKNYFRTGNFSGEVKKDFYGNIKAPLKLVNKRVITPSEEEIASNSRARSARLRIAEKI